MDCKSNFRMIALYICLIDRFMNFATEIKPVNSLILFNGLYIYHVYKMIIMIQHYSIHLYIFNINLQFQLKQKWKLKKFSNYFHFSSVSVCYNIFTYLPILFFYLIDIHCSQLNLVAIDISICGLHNTI